MITPQIIIQIITITYVPATPTAGIRRFAIKLPSLPPISWIRSKSVQVRIIKTSASADFIYAILFSLFDIKNDTIPNSKNGTK